jgi:hypothetical protein
MLRRAVLAAALVAAVLPVPPAEAQLPPTPSEVSRTVGFRPLSTLYAEDFETGTGDFTSGGTSSWQFGVPVSPPTPVPGQGPNMWGTNLEGDYGPTECGWIESPPIDLGAVPVPAPSDPARATAARLAFRSWMHTEFRWDAGIVLASSDGQTWTPLRPFGGYPATAFTRVRDCFGIPADQGVLTTPTNPVPAADAWKLAEFDLTSYLGSGVRLRWVFASDTSVHRRGWYVDDIVIQTGVGAGATVPLPQPGGVDAGFTPAATLYAEDFEAGDGGWTESGTGAWQWGEGVAPPEPLLGSLNMWGTRLDGAYGAGECSTLTSPPLLLPGADVRRGIESARVAFKLWRHTRSGYDGGVLQVSANDGPWETLTPLSGYDRTLLAAAAQTTACLGIDPTQQVWSGPFSQPAGDAWLDVEASLTRYMGNEIRLRLAFGSTDQLDHRGMYLDEVVVRAGTGADETVAQPCESLAGWDVSGRSASWCYGVAASGPTSQQPVWSTNPYGNYNASECSAISSPPIDTALIQGLGALELRFEHFLKTASTDDGGVVQVSQDGGESWLTVSPVGGYNSNLATNARTCAEPGASTLRGWSGSATGTGYASTSFRLSSFDGETIRIRFVFGSGPTTHDLGWYVRGMNLTKGAAPVPLTP